MNMSKLQEKPVLTAQHIAAIEKVLTEGDRVELIPGPNGSIKILHIKRKVVKLGPPQEGKDTTPPPDAPETPPEGE